MWPGVRSGFLAALTLSGTCAFVANPGARNVRLPSVPQKTRPSLAPRVNTARRTSSWNNWGNQYRNGENLARAYGVAGVSSVGFWIASAAAALAPGSTVAQALFFPVPIMTAVYVALANAAMKGGEQVMRLPTYRRLNLGLAISSLGMFGASIQPWLSNGAVAYATGGYPWLVPQALRLWSAGAFAFTSLLCVSTWAKSVESRGIFTRPARGAVGSLWALVPFPRQGGTLDDPEKSDDRAEYAFLAACFFSAAFWPFTQGFPDTGSFVGWRSESAFVAGLAAAPALLFTLLGGVVAYTLKDAAERGRLSDDTYVTLRRGLGLGSGLHLALCIGRLFGTEISSRVGLHMFFPGALAALSVGTASLMIHAVALFVACTPPPSTGYNAQQFGPYQNAYRGNFGTGTGGGGLVPYRADAAPYRDDFVPRGRPMSSGGEGYPASNRRLEMMQGEFAEGPSSNIINEFTPSSRLMNMPGGRDRSIVAPDSRQWPFFSQS